MNAMTFEECISLIKGADNWLLKNYPQDSNLSKEDQLKNAVDKLGDEVLAIAHDVEDVLKKKFELAADAQVSKEMLVSFWNSVELLKNILDKHFDKEINEGKTFPAEYFKGFGTKIEKYINQKSIQLFHNETIKAQVDELNASIDKILKEKPEDEKK